MPGSRQPSVSMAPLVWGRGPQALRHRAGAGRQLPPSSASSEQTHKVCGQLVQVCPQGASQSWCSGVRTAPAKQGQPLSRLLVPRVRLSPAGPDTVPRSPPQPGHWWPPVDPGPFPRASQGIFSFDLAGNCGGHSFAHHIPRCPHSAHCHLQWPWGPPPRDTRVQSSASDQSSSLDPGSSSHPNFCTSRPLP